MRNVVYVSESRIERRQGLLRIAHLPGEPRPVVFSAHRAIAEHYRKRFCSPRIAGLGGAVPKRKAC